jgi:hypothetical protein
MKKYLVTCLLIVALQSCKQNISETDLPKLNGYWEIEKVILPNGEKKEYKINESIDYLEIKDSVGFRKKVYPQLNGKFLINDEKENFIISNTKNGYFINYTTEYTKWKEEIIEIQDSSFVVKNDAKLEYHYKRHQPFSSK